MADRIEALIGQQGWGFWAAERLPDGDGPPQFMGFIGLNRPTAPLPFAPCVEIGWRLARPSGAAAWPRRAHGWRCG